MGQTENNIMAKEGFSVKKTKKWISTLILIIALIASSGNPVLILPDDFSYIDDSADWVSTDCNVIVMFMRNHSETDFMEVASNVVQEGSAIGALNWPDDPFRDGYQFVGWFTLRTGGIEVTADTKVEGDQSVYAQWEANADVTVTFMRNHNTADFTGMTVRDVQEGFAIGELNWPTDPSRNGYQFDGWFTHRIGGTQVTAATSIEGNQNVYAGWIANADVIVTFMRNHSEADLTEVTSRDVQEGLAIGALKWPDDPSCDGFQFDGWFTARTGGTIIEADKVIEDNQNVYAHWTANPKVAVTFLRNYNEADLTEVTSVDVQGGLAIGESDWPTEPSRAGYGFTGWYTQRTGGTHITESTQIEDDQNIYAGWIANADVTVMFMRNHNDADFTEMTSRDVQGGLTIGAPNWPTNPSRSGYQFENWFTERTGGTVVTADTTFEDDQNVYAHWTANEPVTVTFFRNHNSADFSEMTSRDIQGGLAIGELNWPVDPTRAGYEFDGWFTARTGDTQITAATAVESSQNVYAGWIANADVTVNFIRNHNAADFMKVSTQDVQEGLAIGVSNWPNDPTHAGYEFDGWFTHRTGGTEVTVGTALNGDQNVYARWIANDDVTVTFLRNHDEEDLTEVTTRDVQEGLATGAPYWPTDPSRNGYQFNGWFTARTGTTEVTADTPIEDDQNVYAGWTANADVAVTFMRNHDEADFMEVTSQDVQGGLAIGEPNWPTGPSRTGYEFDGWFTHRTGGIEVTASTAIDGNQNVYAEWIANADVTVTFMKNHNVADFSEVTSVDVQGGLTIGELNWPDNPTRDGYQFKGWFTTRTGDIVVSLDTAFEDEQNVYAQWTANDAVTVAFLRNHDSTDTTEETSRDVQGGLAIGVLNWPDNPSRSGYEFAGWFTDRTAGTLVTEATQIESDQNFYAQWTANADVTVRFMRNHNAADTTEVIMRNVQGGLAIGVYNWPTSPYRDGYQFNGWFTTRAGGTEVTDTTAIESDQNVFARWSLANSLTVENFGNISLVTNQSPVSKRTIAERTDIEWVHGTVTNQDFLGWVAQSSTVDMQVGDTWNPALGVIPPTQMPDSDIHYVAVWGNSKTRIIGEPNDNNLLISNLPCHISPAGQTVSSTRPIGKNTTIVAYTTAPDGIDFLGWVDLNEYTPVQGQKIASIPSAALVTEESHTLEVTIDGANWQALWGNEKSGIIGNPAVCDFTIDFQPGAREVTDMPNSRTVTSGSTIFSGGGIISTPSRPGTNYLFDGWSQTTQEDKFASEEVAAIVVTGNMTFTAQWRVQGSEDGTGRGSGAGEIMSPGLQRQGSTSESASGPTERSASEESSGSVSEAAPGSAEESTPSTKPDIIEAEVREITDSKVRMIPSYVGGFPDGTFRPNDITTRAEVVAMFYRLLDEVGRRPIIITPSFSDVSQDAWYARFVKTLAGMGVITGYPDGTFRPNEPITRAELTALITRFVDAASVNANNRFTDLSDTHWAFGSIMQAYSNEWVSGYPDEMFKPDANITRAEAVTVINNATNRHQHEHLLQSAENFKDLEDSQAHWAYINIMLAAEDLIVLE